MYGIFRGQCLTGINKKAEGKAAYDEPVEAMSGILYYREGGAPYNETYYFTRFEKDGTMVEGPTYQCYDSDEDGEIGVEDVYLKDGVEQDRTAWEKETEIYRAIKMSGAYEPESSVPSE